MLLRNACDPLHVVSVRYIWCTGTTQCFFRIVIHFLSSIESGVLSFAAITVSGLLLFHVLSSSGVDLIHPPSHTPPTHLAYTVYKVLPTTSYNHLLFYFLSLFWLEVHLMGAKIGSLFSRLHRMSFSSLRLSVCE